MMYTMANRQFKVNIKHDVYNGEQTVTNSYIIRIVIYKRDTVVKKQFICAALDRCNSRLYNAAQINFKCTVNVYRKHNVQEKNV